MLSRPAPARSAASAAIAMAPPLPWLPPTHSTWPDSPLWLLARRGGSRSGRRDCVQHSAAATTPCQASSGSVSAASCLRPVYSSASPVYRPRWATMNCKVRVARTAAPGTQPRSASTPLGTSSANTSARCAFSASIKACAAPLGARAKPRPNRASTHTSAWASSPLKSATVPPADLKSVAARCANGVEGGLPGSATTCTCSPACSAWRAST
ncbi:hypothetical protein D3C72_859530 [compost metagenome]